MIGPLLLLATLALADPPLVEPADEAGEMDVYIEDGEVVHEIYVYGDHAVEQARLEVMRGLEAEGYTDVEDRGDHIRMRHPQAWKGEVLLYDDGWVRMKRQPVQVVGPEVPWAKKNSPLAYASCVLYPVACIRAGGQTVGRRKLMAVKSRTLQSVYPEVVVYGDRVADRETEGTVNDLPGALEALWYEGVPIGGGETLQTHEARRAALLDFWDSRTDTVWGDRVRLAVEAFIRAEVQTSDWPYLPEEIEAHNVRRTCTRELDLDRSWADVMAEVDPAY